MQAFRRKNPVLYAAFNFIRPMKFSSEVKWLPHTSIATALRRLKKYLEAFKDPGNPFAGVDKKIIWPYISKSGKRCT
jgi:hypothetical protein